MSKKRKNQDADLDTFEELDAKDILDDEEDSDVPLTVELDDAYASEYFQKYESDPNYARNGKYLNKIKFDSVFSRCIILYSINA